MKKMSFLQPFEWLQQEDGNINVNECGRGNEITISTIGRKYSKITN